MTNFNVIGGPNASAYPIVHRIGPADLKDALAKGIADFLAIPSSLIFLCLVFPLFPIPPTNWLPTVQGFVLQAR